MPFKVLSHILQPERFSVTEMATCLYKHKASVALETVSASDKASKSVPGGHNYRPCCNPLCQC